jgi:LAS superfamily LD-carboxypeptidase LdcB
VKNIFTKTHLLVAGALILTLGAIGFAEYKYTSLKNKNADLELNLENAQKELNQIKDENAGLSTSLSSEKDRNDTFQKQIGEISSTVGVLEKIKATDKELLQKYSKVYFLNENYIPSKLTKIDTEYLFNKTKETYIHERVWPHLQDMLEAGAKADINMKIISGYRSFTDQTSLKSTYKTLYGSGANAFSADQGYSEHQLGTTVDLDRESSVGTLVTSFGTTKTFEWLRVNAYKYGFVLSYPKENKFYQYEPWHWRFVGLELAKRLHDDGKYFYEMDQREIDKYLANFFD